MASNNDNIYIQRPEGLLRNPAQLVLDQLRAYKIEKILKIAAVMKTQLEDFSPAM